MAERALSRGAAISIIDRLPGLAEPFYAGPILDRETVRATAAALLYVVAQKDLDIPGMEILAARLGTMGTDHDVKAMKRRRELLWNAAEFFAGLAQALDSRAASDEAVTAPGAGCAS